MELAKSISEHLNVPLTIVKITDFANTEMGCEIKETVRGYNCYIIQTGGAYQGRSINDHLQELYILINACRLSSAKSVQVIIPCFPYARSDKKDAPRVAISGAMQAHILCSLGVTRIVALDLHSGQIQGFSQIPFDNFYCIKLHIENIRNTIFKGLTKDEIDTEFILAAPDTGSTKRTEKYAEILGMKHILMHKNRDYDKANNVLETHLVGEKDCVKNRTVIIVDDIIDTAGTVISAINKLKEHNAKNVILVATHGIFSGPAIDRINACDMIIKVIVTNTLPQIENVKKSNKIQVVDVSEPLAIIIRRLQTNEAGISQLFE